MDGGSSPVGAQVDAADAEVEAGPYEAWRELERLPVSVHRLLGPASVGKRGTQSVPQQAVLRGFSGRKGPLGFWGHRLILCSCGSDRLMRNELAIREKLYVSWDPTTAVSIRMSVVTACGRVSTLHDAR